MNEETVTETPAEESKTPLSRKALIFVGAVAGLLIAGGFSALNKKSQPDCGCEIVFIDFDEDAGSDSESTTTDTQ